MESMSAEIFLITHPRVVFFFFSSYQSIKTHVNTLLSTQKNILFSFKSPFSAIKKHQTVILLARRWLLRYVLRTSRDKPRLFAVKNCPRRCGEKTRTFYMTKGLHRNIFYMHY